MRNPMISWKNTLSIALLAVISAPALIGHAQTDAPTPAPTDSPTSAPTAVATETLPDNGIAPELTDTVWINAAKPVRLADLRGQVVLLDFWTVNCINCFHTQPYLRAAYDKFNGKGVQLVGIHFPEFGYESDVSYVKNYMTNNGLKYPVAIDNDGASWNAYEMHAWPALELIDKNGHRRFRQIGEGNYDRITAAIESLLAEPYTPATPAVTDTATDSATLAVTATAAP